MPLQYVYFVPSTHGCDKKISVNMDYGPIEEYTAKIINGVLS
jgi:hypothetical protein